LKHSGLIISSESLAPDDEAADPQADVESRLLDIAPAQHGLRLDHALVERVPEFSRNYIRQLIEAGAVTLDGVTLLKPAARVKAGQRGSIELRPTLQSQAFKPEAMPLALVYSDAHLLVINKPAGLVVHPAPGNWSGTLLNGLLALDAKAATLPRAGIVHRLDKDTSGLMVVARTRQVMDALVQAIAARTVSRQYLALVQRPWAGPPVRDIEAPIGRDPRNRLRMAVVDLSRTAGKTARTTVAVVGSTASGALVRCTLHTGRTHQIRVHMASIGCPLVADPLYGGVADADLNRQALHACRLAFVHPVDGAELEFHAPLPVDMRAALSARGLSYN
jgi:23S rRNA pseudouridine1911/1915/1917 synthase